MKQAVVKSKGILLIYLEQESEEVQRVSHSLSTVCLETATELAMACQVTVNNVKKKLYCGNGGGAACPPYQRGSTLNASLSAFNRWLN